MISSNCKFWIKYGIYGCILGLMGRKVWTRAHEERTVNLRPGFQPDSSVPTLDPVDSYQNIQPVDYKPIDYTYATRKLIQDQADATRALADYAAIAIADYQLAHGSCNADAVRNQGLGSGIKYTMQTIFL